MELLSLPITKVFLYALLTAVTTGLGALPFFFIKDISPSLLGKSNAAASGLMLAASFSLIMEGYDIDQWMTLGGMLGGVILVVLANRWMEGRTEVGVEDLLTGKRKQMLLFLGIMTVHSFAEGVSVGVSFANTMEFGVFIAIAIAVHNIPEGLAISLVMVPQGTSAFKAVLWSIFSSLPQPLMAIPAFLFVEVFKEYLPFGLGFAAGAMIWMVFADLIPEALEQCSPKKVGLWVTLAILAMSAFQILIGH
ncbi:MAG: ZIP family metal transporter [Gracilimonas sp.]|uniref:ZIP family metal transporter n=1 Tax=Gracilimonas TaxID=649462 RepID=UPI001B22643E|nr:ZIP family metal transporter [Gracilimonas sp.]MBO6587298.1 ZIP family metal transporter [Gracilimonas sp.]MBO6614214.1 ZIP family metal transporter [Gracilimonas sp.]